MGGVWLAVSALQFIRHNISVLSCESVATPVFWILMFSLKLKDEILLCGLRKSSHLWAFKHLAINSEMLIVEG